MIVPVDTLASSQNRWQVGGRFFAPLTIAFFNFIRGSCDEMGWSAGFGDMPFPNGAKKR